MFYGVCVSLVMGLGVCCFCLFSLYVFRVHGYGMHRIGNQLWIIIKSPSQICYNELFNKV